MAIAVPYKTIDPNPYGLSMVECEREANQILWAMIPDPESPPGIELQLIERNNLPILSFFATYDQVFFNSDDVVYFDGRHQEWSYC